MLHPKQPAASVRATRDRVEDLSIDEHHEESTRAAEATFGSSIQRHDQELQAERSES
ncbi:unnamed protein product [Durusdinium trenchii]|uniref:Uncharacterized protein n=1 Tax=Durusdinium trenchii TaxID=1381693 RepID=A0ABP0QWV2_9DINO